MGATEGGGSEAKPREWGGETTGGGVITAGDDDLRVFLVVEIGWVANFANIMNANDLVVSM